MRSLKDITYILVAAAMLAGCQEKVAYLHPLTLSSAEVMMPSEGGRHVIVVYTEGEWTAELSEPVEWAGIETVSGKDMGGIGFVCQENTGISRYVDVIVRQGNNVDSIRMWQEAGASSFSLAFVQSAVRISSAALRMSIGFNTNISNLSSCTRCTVTDGMGKEAGWISDIQMSRDMMSFTVAATNVERVAHIAVTAVNPADESRNVTARLTLTQTEENPYLLPVADAVEKPFAADAATVTIPLRTNLTYSLEQLVGTASASEDWVSVQESESVNAIDLVLGANEGETSRECTISLPYVDLRGNSCTFSFKIVQAASTSGIAKAGQE